MPKRSSIEFVEQDEPAFIKKIKSKVGYVEPPTINDKLTTEVIADGDEGNFPDEAPTVVVLNEGDLTEKEAKKIEDNIIDKKKISDGRISFIESTKTVSKKAPSKMAATKNSCLLSFDEDDDSDEDT